MKSLKLISTTILLLAFLLVHGQTPGNLKVDLRAELDSLETLVPGLKEKVDFTLVDAPIYELLRAVAETHNLNVSLNNLPEINITNNFTNVSVKDLILFICHEHDLKIRFTNNIFAFYREKPLVVDEPIVVFDNESGLIGFNLRNTNLNMLARELTIKSGYNLIINRGAANQNVNVYLQGLTVEKALQNLADVNDLELTKKDEKVFQLDLKVVQNSNTRNDRGRTSMQRRSENFDLLSFKSENKNYISLNGSGVPLEDIIITACEDLKVDYLFLTQIQGTMDCRLDSVLFEDFLIMALESSNLSYSVSMSGVYLIGAQQTEGLSEARVFKFKNRSVEGMVEIIPQSLTKQVQIKPFNDLNALIITGSDKSANKLVQFLEQIDQPVPNILIEVIVAEVQKGDAVRTGVKAFLGDSVPPTAGQVFGGVDVTLSPTSINKMLSNLDSRGIMNLGRVTPQFYASIQAMEDNNNLDIKSTPKLSTLNGHEASLRIGQSVYYLVETQNVTGGVNPIVTVTPRYENVEANLDLKITPFVSQYEDVTLTIEAEFSDFIPPAIQGAPPGNATRMFISKIRVKNEETIVLGGLEEVSKSESGSGTPFLSRVPGLKWLFSSKSKENSESKLMIFVKPTIVY